MHTAWMLHHLTRQWLHEVPSTVAFSEFYDCYDQPMLLPYILHLAPDFPTLRNQSGWARLSRGSSRLQVLQPSLGVSPQQCNASRTFLLSVEFVKHILAYAHVLLPYTWVPGHAGEKDEPQTLHWMFMDKTRNIDVQKAVTITHISAFLEK